jgi:DNA-binding transcriptional MocR family regulator
MLVAGLRDLLARVAPRLIYVSSSFNNPTGAMLSQERRRDLARLAAEYQIPLLEDCVISEVCLTGRPMLPPIASFGDDGPVMTIGSMSKVFWGGLRVGWIRAPKPVIFRLAQLKAVHDLGSPVIDQVLCADLLRDHASEAREWRIRDCLPRLQHLTQELARLLPAWSCEQPQGGLALWVRLPDGSAADFQQAALRHGVELAAGPIFSPDGSHADRLRLGFALPTEQISEGVRRLASAWAAYLPRSDRPLLEAKLIV